MDDVTALRDALLAKLYGRGGFWVERGDVRKSLDALIAAVEARVALTPERLARAIHRECEAEWDRKATRDPLWQGTMHGADAHDEHASAILAASLARALSLGVAWLAAEAALPEGWIVSAVGITGVIGTDGKPEAWQAEAIQTTGYDFWAGEDPAEDAEAVGPTPESALAALADALRKEQK